MKKILITIICIFMVYAADCQTYSISGKVIYKNTTIPRTLDSTTIQLYQNASLLSTYTTVTGGEYTFGNLQPGTYELILSCPKRHGGTATNDALFILRHFVHMPPLLTGLNLAAADVTADGARNAVDGMFCSMRFTGMLLSFPSGDWVFENPVVVISNADVVLNIYGLCYGDVNGSYIPLNGTNP